MGEHVAAERRGADMGAFPRRRGTIGRLECRMKTAGLFCAVVVMLAWTGAVRGEVVATARSPEGKFAEFRVVLDAEGAPVAVANFMGLLDGSQRWVDPETGLVRGGAGDAFYGGMVFDWNAGSVLRGALRGVVGTNGAMEYTGRPGYTIRSEVGTNGWNTVDEGALAYVERMPVEEWLQPWMGWEVNVLNSGGGELALFLEEGIVPWTVFGHVAAGDEEGLRQFADAVASGVTAVEWSVDTERMTEAEASALGKAREELAVVEGIGARTSKKGVAWEVSGRSLLMISTTENPETGWNGDEGVWNEGTEEKGFDVGWEELRLEGRMGFSAFVEVRYPGMAGVPLGGKWRIGAEHTDKTMQYWLDFDGGTGMWAQVESGEITAAGTVSRVACSRATANSLRVTFSMGAGKPYYWLSVVADGLAVGRFQSVQVSPLGTDRDSGRYEWAEGWGETAKAVARRLARKGESKAPRLGGVMPDRRRGGVTREESRARNGGATFRQEGE